MILTGHIRGGAVVFDGQPALPEGVPVRIEIDTVAVRGGGGPVRLPIVPSKNPGTVRLTNDRIAELLAEDEGVPAGR